MNRFTLPIFWSLAALFIFILAEFFVPPIRDIFRGSKLFLLPLIIFSLTGLILLILSIKIKERNKLRKFFILTGLSATGFFVFIFLHNAFYALAVLAEQLLFIKYLMEVFHIIFFFLAIFISPLAFLVGLIGSLIILIKKT